MANGDCPACGEVTKPDMTWLEKNRDRLEMELERVEAELNTVEVTMEELEDTDKAGDSGQLRTQLEAGLERLGPSGTEFVGSTCSSCHRTYTRYPLMGTDTRCDGCWHDEVEEAEHPTVGSVSWPDVIFFAVFLVAIILGILMAVFQ